FLLPLLPIIRHTAAPIRSISGQVVAAAGAGPGSGEEELQHARARARAAAELEASLSLACSRRPAVDLAGSGAGPLLAAVLLRGLPRSSAPPLHGEISRPAGARPAASAADLARAGQSSRARNPSRRRPPPRAKSPLPPNVPTAGELPIDLLSRASHDCGSRRRLCHGGPREEEQEQRQPTPSDGDGVAVAGPSSTAALRAATG
ncbi:unnamed protein product, partial [Urochloa humidicola]